MFLQNLTRRKSLPELEDKRICMFSYGSGLIASMYSLRAASRGGQYFSLELLKSSCSDLNERLDARSCVDPKQFVDILNRREEVYNKSELLFGVLLLFCYW